MWGWRQPYLTPWVHRRKDDIVLVSSRGHMGQRRHGVLAPLANLRVPLPAIQHQPITAIIQDVAAPTLLRPQGCSAVFLPLVGRRLQVVGRLAGRAANHALRSRLDLWDKPPDQQDDLCGTVPGRDGAIQSQSSGH